MRLTDHTVRAHEWIGLKISVNKSPDPSLAGVSGTVRDETKNTFTIETDNRTIRVAKHHTAFRTTLSTGQTIEVNGDQLLHRPEDRIKKGLAKW